MKTLTFLAASIITTQSYATVPVSFNNFENFNFDGKAVPTLGNGANFEYSSAVGSYRLGTSTPARVIQKYVNYFHSNLQNSSFLSGLSSYPTDNSGSNFQHSNLAYSTMEYSNMDGVILFDIDMSGARVSGATFVGAKFEHVNVTGINTFTLPDGSLTFAGVKWYQMPTQMDDVFTLQGGGKAVAIKLPGKLGFNWKSLTVVTSY